MYKKETDTKKQETTIGLTENEFKTRFNLHKSSFKLEHKRTTTSLSDHIWKLKKKNIENSFFSTTSKNNTHLPQVSNNSGDTVPTNNSVV